MKEGWGRSSEKQLSRTIEVARDGGVVESGEDNEGFGFAAKGKVLD